jgi:hypothetical protein
MNGWSESLRQELLPDVRVTLVEILLRPAGQQ